MLRTCSYFAESTIEKNIDGRWRTSSVNPLESPKPAEPTRIRVIGQVLVVVHEEFPLLAEDLSAFMTVIWVLDISLVTIQSADFWHNCQNHYR